MNFDFNKIKDKVVSATSEIKIVKDKTVKDKSDKTNKVKKSHKKESASDTIKRLVEGYLSKDKEAKHVMKQSEKGFIMIVASLLIGYGSYSFLYKPALSDHKIVEDANAKTQKRRLEIETQLDNQGSLVKSIALYDSKLSAYKLMYPNYRTENEILKVIEMMLSREQVLPATFVKGTTKIAQKSTIALFIANKGLDSKINEVSYFKTANAATDEQTNQAPQEGDQISEEDKSNFEYTEVSFTVSDITKERGLSIMNTFATSERVIIPESWKLIGQEEGKYQLEATVLFFSYRDSETFEPLFE